MSERRPHWDDDLIDAVRDAVDVEFDGIWKLSEDSIRAVIAAVEDWARWEHVPKGTLARLEQAEAAIERVRKLCDDFEHEENLNGGIGRYAVVRVDRVRSALDGAS